MNFLDQAICVVGGALGGCAVADGLLTALEGDTANGLFMLALGLTLVATTIFVMHRRAL